jgi:hypothetical protein
MTSALAWQAALPVIHASATVEVIDANETLQAPDADLFIRVGGRSGDSGPGEVGRNAMWTEEGSLEILLLARLGIGTLAARQEADRIVSGFRQDEDPYFEWTGWSLDEAENQGNEDRWALVLTVRYRTQTVTA